MDCFITSTGSFLPGARIGNDDIELHLGQLVGEAEVKATVLKMNGIIGRHYAQDANQQQTHDVYQLACEAIKDCLDQKGEVSKLVSLLSAGTTYAPMSGPGICSILHSQLSELGLLTQSVEVSSNSGICTSAAAALVSSIRSVVAGEHAAAICVGTEHPSRVLKAETIDPIDDRDQHTELRRSQWFMSVFLRFMLSDGAGAFLLQNQPNAKGVSFRVDWTHSRSFAHQTPLCMKLENQEIRLSQDISILSKYLMPMATQFAAEAMARHGEDLINYKFVLPHLSSFFFRKKTERLMQKFTSSPDPVPYWTNLATAGNTGAASIFVMLDQYLRDESVCDGDRIMLFIPESGQFNFVMVSLTAVVQ